MMNLIQWSLRNLGERTMVYWGVERLNLLQERLRQEQVGGNRVIEHTLLSQKPHCGQGLV